MLLRLSFLIELSCITTWAYTPFRKSNAGIRRVSEVVDEIDASVTDIDLSDNEITRIYARDFAKFRRCKKLELRGNKMHTIDVGGFEGLVSLEDLRLWSNKLTVFPNLTDVPRLTRLYVADNMLSGDLPAEVHISKTNILNDLKMNKNSITSASAEFFANFPRLKVLHIYQNRFTKVPPIYSIANSLEEFIFGSNPILTAHSSDLVRNGMNSALKILQWSNSGSCDDCTNPPVIDHDFLSNLDNLEKLWLVNLDLEKLPDFSNIVDTTTHIIILRNKRLAILDPKWFLGNPPDYGKDIVVEEFAMDGNSLKTVPRELLQALRSVRNLRFAENVIECFPMSALKNLPSLNTLGLENNFITTLDDIGHRSRSYFQIDVSGNQLTCDERLCWLFESKYWHYREERSPYPCFSPQRFAALTYEEVTPEILGCDGSPVDFTVNCSNPDQEYLPPNLPQTTNTTKQIDQVPSTSAGPIDPKKPTSSPEEDVDPDNPRKNDTESPVPVKENLAKDDEHPDAVWILVGMVVMGVPVVVGVMVYCKLCGKSRVRNRHRNSGVDHVNPIFIGRNSDSLYQTVDEAQLDLSST